ncbi:Translational repressor [Thecaphora frezii]
MPEDNVKKQTKNTNSKSDKSQATAASSNTANAPNAHAGGQKRNHKNSNQGAKTNAAKSSPESNSTADSDHKTAGGNPRNSSNKKGSQNSYSKPNNSNGGNGNSNNNNNNNSNNNNNKPERGNMNRGNSGSSINSNSKRDTASSIHARKTSTPASPDGGRGSSAALNNLQQMIQDIKSTPPSGRSNSGGTDASADLAAVTSRLQAQEEHLQAQLQQQLNLSSTPGGRGSFASRGGGLASLGEDAEAEHGGQGQNAFQRQGGPRFAGNAAFQSAVARHAAHQSADLRATNAHQRQLSLQGRFAELGYNLGSGLGPSPNEMDDMTDDGASSIDYMGGSAFDPTRHGLQDYDVGGNAAAHRRTGSDISGLLGGRQVGTGIGGNLNSLTAQSQMYADQQVAIQQQIEMLQLQQQQLMQQQAAFGHNANGGPQQFNLHQNFGGAGGHRRIQSHAPQTGPMGSFSSSNSVGTGLSNYGVSQQSPTPTANLPRGHGRRHSVNVVNKANQAPTGAGNGNNGQNESGPTMQPNLDFSFPNNLNRNRQNAGQQQNQSQHASQGAGQQQQQQQHQHQSLLPAFNPSSQPQATMGHFSHPSLQLQQLSPEYLMAGGGLISLNSLNGGGSMTELADGFGGSGGGGSGGGRGGHGRTNSTGWRINGTPGGPQVMDLASAQAQLASLRQFRAQAGGAGGHHHKTPSFGGGFNPMGPPGFQGPGGQFNGGFNGQQGGQGGALQRKALFGNYLQQSSLPVLLAEGKLVVGVLRINKRNRSDAYVTTEVLDSDIFISGSKDRNRALEGDLVAVELLDPLEVWNTKKEKEDKKKRKEEQTGLSSRKPDKAKDDLEVEGAQLKLIEDEEENESTPPTFAGHVVAIVERAPGQLFSGTLGRQRPSSAATQERQQAERAQRDGVEPNMIQEVQPRPKIIWFRPSDKRVPLIAIPADQAPRDFWEEGGQESYNNRLFVACIKRWPITSLHPFGTLVEEIGVIGNVEAETQALLKDSLSSATEEFGDNALKCLPPLPWSIPEKERETRRDFRSHRVFTIDPETAKDLDDALSITKLDGGLYEIGVHIADVSHFVKLGSALDREARKRGTSVYLVQRAIPMLPPTLCEELCSLVPNVERLAFSAVFTMNEEARVIGRWFGKTVIKSCAKLAYSDAQQVIEGGELPEGKVQEHKASDVAEDIKILDRLAKKMRARRFDGGALKINNVKLSFRLDENGLPMDANIYKTYDAHQLIEEFMLQANMDVASQIAAGLPDVALLRRHECPLDRRLDGFLKRAKSMGYEIDISTAGSLYKSLQKIDDEKTRVALETLVTKAMLRAKYFCTGMVDIAKYQHYALNVQLYTHFTSPIRRYADLMVHRQLEAVLAKQDKFAVDREAMAKIAQQCNVKKDAAKMAQEQSAHLFLCLLIHDLTMRYGPVIRTATVIGVLDAAFDVVVPEFGVEKRVHVDQMPIEHHTYEVETNALSIYWKKDVDVISWLAENSDDVHVKKLQEVARQHAAMEMTSQSQADEAALFDDDDEDGDGGVLAMQRFMASAEEVKGSQQRAKSFNKPNLTFEGLSVLPTGHHRIQSIRELQQIPVIITSDMSKSPPVLKVFSVNPWSNGNEPAV